MPDATEPQPDDFDVDELHKYQGSLVSPRCHWCGRTKVRDYRALVCPHCDVPEKE